MTDTLKYPIGRFAFDPDTAAAQREGWISDITHLPHQLEAALDGLSEEQLDTPYRPDGWTVRQVVHHVADSHLNAYIRVRWALTEEQPTIKAYDEKLWAELHDASTDPVAASLQLLGGLHARWTSLLKNLAPDEFHRTLVHPVNGPGTIERYTCLYAWHGRHHVAHVTALRERMGW
ncbi:MAG: putative metal-dependent hydrolase [Bryobacterales bacterium]|nr:putative metal-dependent hydrolase [Bryobacterales bacterium]